MKTLIVQASARNNGDTAKVVAHLAHQLDAQVIDLLEYTIHPFNYAQEYPDNDGFLSLYQEHLLIADQILLATPIYWYTMSGTLKIFLDRFSDLLMSQQDLGRKLRGKHLAVLSVGNDATVPLSFYAPFELSAEYLGMEYGPVYHGWLEEGEVRVKMQ